MYHWLHWKFLQGQYKFKYYINIQRVSFQCLLKRWLMRETTSYEDFSSFLPTFPSSYFHVSIIHLLIGNTFYWIVQSKQTCMNNFALKAELGYANFSFDFNEKAKTKSKQTKKYFPWFSQHKLARFYFCFLDL